MGQGTIAEVLSGAATWAILAGDCAARVREIPNASVDSIVADPPAGISFMGRAWDTDKGGEEQWIAWLSGIMAEGFRVLKPGGYCLLWALPRTSDWTMQALRRAGFEVRDVVTHLFGSGFPKSLDVSKAIDSRRIDDIRPVCRFLRAAMSAAGLSSSDISARFGFHSRMVDHWAARDTDSQPTVPTPEQWEQLRGLLGFGAEMDAEVDRLNGRKGERGDAWNDREIIGEHEGTTPGLPGMRFSAETKNITAPATPEARRWSGFGTALKPAAEFWILARKPLSGTVAANVLAHGTGALNVDGCRVSSCSVTGQRLQSEPWEQGVNLCDSCVSHAAQSERRSTPATAGSSATDNAALTTPAKAKRSRAGTSKTDIGCSGGQNQGGRSGALFDDSNSSTAPSGKSTTGLSQMGTSSTTSTRSRPTTGSKTCTSCGAAITSGSTQSNPTSTPEAEPLPPMRSDGETTIPSMPPSMLSRNASDAPAGRFPANLVLSHAAWEETHCPCGAVLSFVARFCPECGSAGVEHRRAGCQAVGERRVKGGTPASGPTLTGESSSTSRGKFNGVESTPFYADPDGLETVTAWECLATCACGLSTLAPSGGSAPRCRCGRAMAWACPVARLDEQSGSAGMHSAGGARGNVETKSVPGYGGGFGNVGAYRVGDTDQGAMASRFFNTFSPPDDVEPFLYSPKPSAAETEAGCEHLPTKRAHENVDREEGSAALNSPRTGAGRTSGRKNHHPTKKSIALMRHFVRLVTPPSGIVLDLFGGSGTTGCAAVLEGMRAILCEMEAEYVAIEEARIAFWERLAGTQVASEGTPKPKRERVGTGQGDLFASVPR